MLQVVAVPDELPGDPFERGLLLPVPGPGKNGFIMEPRDGRDTGPSKLAGNRCLVHLVEVRAYDDAGASDQAGRPEFGHLASLNDIVTL